MNNIRSKIIINVVLLLITIIVIVGMEFNDLRQLAKIQDDGAKRSADAVIAEVGARVGLSLHAVITDAIIRHDLVATAREWAEAKALNLKRLDAVAKAADTSDEKEWTETAQKATHEIITIFETRMLPLLTLDKGTSKIIKELDEAVDSQVKIVHAMMLKANESMANEAKAADEVFDNAIRRAIIKSLIVGLTGIMLQSLLASWLMRTIMNKDSERKKAEETLRDR